MILGILAAILFSGNVANDFPGGACMSDTSVPDVGLPSDFPSSQISGFDIKAVCYSYDTSNDTLYVGLQTYNDANGQAVIFGDADGDGNASSPSTTLVDLLGNDLADLGGGEYVTVAIDLNKDNTPDLVAGVNNTTSLSGFQAVAGNASPDNNPFLAPLARFYGAAIAGVSATVPFFPSSTKPHLEFSISGISNVNGYASLDFANPDSSFRFYVSAGSIDDDGIAEDYFPNSATAMSQAKLMKAVAFKDVDGDTINDFLDTDNDNDGICDLIEKNLVSYDTNGNCILSASEAAASGKDSDGDGDIDTNDAGIAYPDTDGDGTADYLDTDSDADGISDASEKGSGTTPRDSDSDGIYDFRETDSDGDGLADNIEDADKDGTLDSNETDPTKFDSDGDGLCDGTTVVFSCTGSEKAKGTDPRKVDTDGDGLCDGSIVVSPCFNSEGNLKTDPLVSNIVTTSGSRVIPTPTGTQSTGSGTNATTSPILGGDVDTSQGPVRLQGSGCSVVGGSGSLSMLFWWLFLLFSVGFVPKVWGVNADLYRNSSDGLGFFTLESEEPLKKREFSLGLSQHIVNRPIELGTTRTGASLDGVVNYFYVWQFWGAYGLFENLDLGINFPVSLVTQIEDVNSSQERNGSSVGDIRLNAKWELFRKVALLSYLQIPSGNTDDFFGEGSITGGLKAIADTDLGAHQIGVNLGVNARGKESVVSSGITLLEVGPSMTWSLGWRWLFDRNHQWYLASNFWGQTDFQGVATSPSEWDWGLQKRWEEGMEGSLGMGFGIGKGYGAPTYRIILGLSYVPERKAHGSSFDKLRMSGHGEPLKTGHGEPVEPQAKLEGKEIVILQPVHFETNRAVIRPQSYPILNSVANLLKQNQTILKIRIEGHTDNEGPDRLNLRLSQERAEAVKAYLVKQGITDSRLQTRGWGESHPQVLNASDFNKAKNRRVEFHVMEVEK